MIRRLKKFDRFMDSLNNYTVTILCGMILGITIVNTVVRPRQEQEPKPPQYIVVEYTPECDCYRIVDVVEEMKGIENNE